MKSFGEFLKMVRKEAVMTQRNLAKKIGVGYPYISKLENNIEPPPSNEVLLRLAKELNVEVDEMFINARRLPLDLEKFLIQNPEAIKLLRLIKKEDATLFFLNHFKEFMMMKDNKNWDFCGGTEKVVLLIDPETLRIVYANKAATRFYKCPIEEFKKIRITDLNILPEDQVFEAMQRAISESNNYFCFKHRLKNAEIREVRVCSNPIVINGKTYLNSVIQDVSSIQ